MKFLRTLLVWAASAAALFSQLTPERLRNAPEEPQNWLTHNGTYLSRHHSGLDQITRENVGGLVLRWAYQVDEMDRYEATPLVVDGVMYASTPVNNVVALGANSGRVFWSFRYDLPVLDACCGRVNRGLGMHGQTLFMGTMDGHLLALDARTGDLVWDVKMADYTRGYSLTHAPLVIKDMVLMGTAGGEYGIRGHLDAYDVKTGKRLWRFYTVPGPGEPGHETWENDAWKTGGASIWITGSYDPELNLTYWGIGNPGPDWNGDSRPGDNLYSSSLIALDADTGKLKWHFQFTPHDEWDFDSTQVPVLVDMEFRGQQRKVILTGNRNGFFYVLDRETGEFLMGKPFVKVTWASGLDDSGRPIEVPGKRPTFEGTLVYPGVQGGTNWYAPSYSPRTGLFYLSVWDDYASVFFKREQEYRPGSRYTAGGARSAISSLSRREIPRGSFESDGYGAVRALDPKTGEKVWDFRMTDVSDSGLLSTAGGIVFSGSREGHFFALDDRTGELLWSRSLGGQISASPITFEVDGEQLVSVTSGHAIFVFGLKGKHPTGSN